MTGAYHYRRADEILAEIEAANALPIQTETTLAIRITRPLTGWRPARHGTTWIIQDEFISHGQLATPCCETPPSAC